MRQGGIRVDPERSLKLGNRFRQSAGNILQDESEIIDYCALRRNSA
jgi:hypothetical protein